MMSVDFTGWKSGDRGVMEVEFEFIETGGRMMTMDGGFPAVAVRILGAHANERIGIVENNIKSITRIDPPIKVGDRVYGNGHNGSVVGIHERHAAVAWDDGDKSWPLISGLERIA